MSSCALMLSSCHGRKLIVSEYFFVRRRWQNVEALRISWDDATRATRATSKEAENPKNHRLLTQHYNAIQHDKISKIAELKRCAEQEGELTEKPSYWPEWRSNSPLAKALERYEHNIVQPTAGAYPREDDGSPCTLKPKVSQNDRKTDAIVQLAENVSKRMYIDFCGFLVKYMYTCSTCISHPSNCPYSICFSEAVTGRVKQRNGTILSRVLEYFNDKCRTATTLQSTRSVVVLWCFQELGFHESWTRKDYSSEQYQSCLCWTCVHTDNAKQLHVRFFVRITNHISLRKLNPICNLFQW